MGLPTTWSLLNLYHGWCWAAALATDPLPRGPERSHPITKSRARICGDDLIGCTSPAGKDAYEGRLRRTGAELSDGKHFWSPDRGVFLEVLWDFRGDRVSLLDGAFPIYKTIRKGGKGRGARVRVVINTVRLHRWNKIFTIGAIPLRGLVFGDSRHGASAPDWWSAGATETAYAARYDRKLVSAVARTIRPNLPGLYERAGIPPFLPRVLGGGGLCPTSDKLAASSTHRKALATLLYGVGDHSPPSAFERVWSDSRPTPHREMASDDVENWMRVAVVTVEGGLGPLDWVAIGDPEEVRESLIQRMSREYELLFGPAEESENYPSLEMIGRRISQVRAKLLGEWASAHPLKKPLPECMSRWNLLRESQTLWVPEWIPDDLVQALCGVQPMPMRYNSYLMEKRDATYLQTWRRFATAAVSREGPWWVDYILPPGVFP